MTPSREPTALGEPSDQLDLADPRPDSAPPDAGAKRNFNEAAHKLGYWPVTPSPRKERAPSAELQAAGDDSRDVIAHAGTAILGLGALGIVYGDLGTSPLYTMQAIFQQHADAATPTISGVYGIASLVFWALMVEVSIKYAGFIMRAHNRGDGGIMALTSLVQRRKVPHAGILIVLGIFGAGLFFGDGMITPAISVISAVEGLNVVSSGLSHLVVPISLVILIGLFAVQRFGTGAVGWLFGPVILVFFSAIALLGLGQVVAHPGVLQALSPTWGARFIADHGVAAFLTLGSVVLCVTGAEALYADRGHFGARPIRLTWFSIVLPAVLLSYLGQGAYILGHATQVRGQLKAQTFDPFYQLIPSALQIPMVILATMATIIASQAALTGSFSVAKQAVTLGFLPRLKIVHTSNTEGQIYVPIINWFLCLGVVTLVLVFQHSAKLTEIYGVAVTGTFILNTILFLSVARSLWRTAVWKLAILGTLFLVVEIAFFASNLTKISHGAYLSLGVGLVIATIMITWRKGREIVTRNRTEQEGSLQDFLDALCASNKRIVRLPGTAIFLNPGKVTTPLALRAQVAHNHAFHDKVVIVSLDQVSIPRVDKEDRISVERLGQGLFKIWHVTIRVGYRDKWNVPGALALARKQGLLDRNLDLEHASYFVSRMTIVPTDASGMARWRKRLFVTMARNATSPIDHFGLPTERTVMTGTQVAI
jgi:KUP system potassium uptake protein